MLSIEVDDLKKLTIFRYWGDDSAKLIIFRYWGDDLAKLIIFWIIGTRAS